jgi:hypothetical protein
VPHYRAALAGEKGRRKAENAFAFVVRRRGKAGSCIGQRQTTKAGLTGFPMPPMRRARFDALPAFRLDPSADNSTAGEN